MNGDRPTFEEETQVPYEFSMTPMNQGGELIRRERERSSKKRALYLFAGAKRHSSVKDYLEELGWQVDEVDILRSKRQDLTKKAYAEKLLEKITRGQYTALLGSPPCDTYSRVKFANRKGPRPLRTKEFGRGFPWLRGHQKKLAQLANTLTDFMWSAAAEQVRHTPGLLALEFSEDLGKVAHGVFAG